MTAAENHSHSDWGRKAAFFITTIVCSGVWFYFRINQYGTDYLALNTDTMVLYQDYKYIYDSFFTFGEFPLWNPHFLYGSSELFWYFEHSPLELVSIVLGKYFEQESSYYAFNAVLATEQCILVAGMGLLLWRFNARWIALLLLLPVLLFPMSYQFSVWHTQRCIYLMPFMMYFTLDFVRHGRMLGLAGMLVTWAAGLFGNIPYDVVFIFYASALFFIALVVTNSPGPSLSQILLKTWQQLDRRILAALGLSLLVSFCYYYVLSADRLFGHIEIIRAGRDDSLKIPLDLYVYINTLEFSYWVSLPITLFTLDKGFQGQPFIGVVNTYFLVYLLSGRTTKFVKIALVLMLFGLLFMTSKWFLVKYIVYWLPGAALFRQVTPIFMIAKLTLVVLAALGFSNFVRDLIKGEFLVNPFRLAVGVAAGILLIVAFHHALLTPASQSPDTEVQVAAIFVSILVLGGVGWAAQRYAPTYHNRKNFPVLAGVAGLALAGINFVVISNLAREHALIFRLSDLKNGKLSAEQIKRDYFVRPFELPLWRSQDIFSEVRPPGRSVNSSWLSANGGFPCAAALGTNTISKPVAEFFLTSSKLFPDRNYLLYLLEGTGIGPEWVFKSDAARRYLACALPIVRVSTNVAVVDSTASADKLLYAVFQDKRDFVDVIVDATAAPNVPAERGSLATIWKSWLPAADVDTTFYSPHKVVFKVTTTEPGWLIFTDGFDSRWSATVDGTSTAIRMANRGFKAVPVSTGSHEVVFKFRNYGGIAVIWLLVILLPVCLVLSLGLALMDFWIRPATPPFPG